jgi:hypothetical protein
MSEQTKRQNEITRRQFAQAAATAAAAAAVSNQAIAQIEKATPVKSPATAPGESQLSPAARAEGERKLQAIIQQYGSRLNAEQRTDLRRMLMQQQKSLQSLRAYALHNWDEPATVLHLGSSGERQ